VAASELHQGCIRAGGPKPVLHRPAQVKDALSGTGIEYEEIELSGQLKLLESIKKTTGRTTVPQVGPFWPLRDMFLGQRTGV